MGPASMNISKKKADERRTGSNQRNGLRICWDSRQYHHPIHIEPRIAASNTSHHGQSPEKRSVVMVPLVLSNVASLANEGTTSVPKQSLPRNKSRERSKAKSKFLDHTKPIVSIRVTRQSCLKTLHSKSSLVQPFPLMTGAVIATPRRISWHLVLRKLGFDSMRN